MSVQCVCVCVCYDGVWFCVLKRKEIVGWLLRSFYLLSFLLNIGLRVCLHWGLFFVVGHTCGLPLLPFLRRLTVAFAL